MLLLTLNCFLPAMALESKETLNDLIQKAKKQNPELQAAWKKWDAIRTEIPTASALPDPHLRIGLQNMEFGTISLGMEPMSNGAILFDQEIPFPGKLQLKRALMAQESRLFWQTYRMTEWDMVTQLKKQYYELYTINHSITLIKTIQKILHKLLKTSEIRYSVGHASQSDVFKAQLEIAMQTEQLQMLQQQKDTAMIQINQWTGSPNQPHLKEIDLPVTPPDLPPLETLEEWALQHSPALQEEILRIERMRLGVEVAKSEYWPDFMLEGGYMNRGTLSPMWELSVGVNLPIYAAQKQDVMLQVAYRSVEEALISKEKKWQMIQSELRQVRVMAHKEWQLKWLYETTILPQARKTLDTSLASYTVGKVDFMTVLENLRELLTYERLVVEKQVRYYQAVVELEHLVAVELIHP